MFPDPKLHQCQLCHNFSSEDRHAMGEHLATEHPDEWEMAVQVVAMGLIGPA